MMDLTGDLRAIFDRNPATPSPNLGELVSRFLNLALILAGFLLLIWMVWGAVSYIMAGGDKESLAKARARILYAIIGFIVIMAAFTIKQYAQSLIPQRAPSVREVSNP